VVVVDTGAPCLCGEVVDVSANIVAVCWFVGRHAHHTVRYGELGIISARRYPVNAVSTTWFAGVVPGTTRGTCAQRTTSHVPPQRLLAAPVRRYARRMYARRWACEWGAV